MMGKEKRSSESLCEKSMLLVANIIKLSSSLSFTKIPAHDATPPPRNPAAVSPIPGSRRLQEPQSRAKPIYVTKPGGGTSFHIRGSPNQYSSPSSSPYVIREEMDFDEANVDGWASEYIERIHQKNRKDSDEATLKKKKKPSSHPTNLSTRHRKTPTVLN